MLDLTFKSIIQLKGLLPTMHVGCESDVPPMFFRCKSTFVSQNERMLHGVKEVTMQWKISRAPVGKFLRASEEKIVP